LRAILKAMTRDRSPEENRKIRWGESVKELITLLSHSPQAAALRVLVQGG